MAPMLTVRDIAADLQLTEQTVSQKLKSQVIPGGTRAFGAWRVDPEAYESWKAALTAPRTVGDEHLIAPRSARAAAAKKAAATRSKNPK